MSTLKAGALGSPNVTGLPAAFAGSMAADIEAALNRLLNDAGVDAFPVDDNSRETRDRRRLFVAIAQGVVDHLKSQESAFVIRNKNGDAVALHIDLQRS